LTVVENLTTGCTNSPLQTKIWKFVKLSNNIFLNLLIY
jgi:hypothetical protein